jgi:hypothetical protein
VRRSYLIVVPVPMPAAPHRYLIVAPRPLPAAALVVRHRYLILWPRPSLRCASQVLDRGAQTDAPGAVQVLDRGDQVIAQAVASLCVAGT